MAYKLPQSKFFPAMKSVMLPPNTFNGKSALVTGGGTGLGKGMALMLSQLGATVAIIGRRENVLQETAKEINNQTGNKVIFHSTDIRNAEAVKESIDKIEKEIGLPTLLINNAAGNFISPTERLSTNAWRTIIDIVLNGTANVTLDLGKRLIAAQKGGSILSISTIYTNHGSGFVAPSASAKAGVECLMKSIASEWGRYGIRANIIQPGPIDTEGAMSRLDPTGAFRELGIQRLPVGRFGEVPEFSNLASFILSDYASWMTGSVIVYDGGELPFISGSFNNLVNLDKKQWDQMEKMIRKSNEKSKSKL